MNNIKYINYGIKIGLAKNNVGGTLLNPLKLVVTSQRNYPEVRKRFYKNVTVAGSPESYEINLDHRKLKTPGGNILQISNYPLALAVASEWMSVEEKIIPAWMTLTGLSYTVVDNPQKLTKAVMVDQTLEYMETDTILFREEAKDDFLSVQMKEWDPILDWFNDRFRVNLKPSEGICAAEVSDEALENLRKYFMSYNTWAAYGILFGVEAIKSVILTAACVERKITPEKAVQLTLLETDFQTQRWGSVEWAHEMDKYDLLSRFSAAVLFVHLNSSSYLMKQKNLAN